MKKTRSKLGRNSPCPCGSGLKYKKCCLKKNSSYTNDIASLYAKKYRIRLKNDKDILGIKKAGILTLNTINLIKAEIKAGVTTEYLDSIAYDFITKNNGFPATLNYRGFPKSICVSVNDEVCHGVPGSRVLKDGDIVNIDITTKLDGYYADASKTFFVGSPGPQAIKIVNVSKQCLKTGIEAAIPGNTVGDIGWAIEQTAKKENCSVVREYVGHGVGFEFHEQPQIPHFGKKGRGIKLIKGMVFTIEPMINLGKRHLHILDDKWTAVTNDGSLSAQFEQTVLITENGVESLTPFDTLVPEQKH